ncbi:MAG: FAD-dependent oxidoreductase, partial [Fibrobacterota bacterium]
MSDKILIIGGVAGGASAAARLRRNNEDCKITILERGPYISFANCGLPYYLGDVIKDRDCLLVQTPESFRDRFNVDVLVNTEALSIDRKNKKVQARNNSSGEEKSFAYDKLILSPGAAAVKPPIPGIDSEGIYNLKTIPDMDAIKKELDGGAKSAVVIGGGFIGVEAAENLKEKGLDVSLVEALPQVMSPMDPEMAAMLHRDISINGIRLFLSNPVKSFERKNGRIVCALKNGGEIEADFAVLSIGVKPENALAVSAGLEICENGGIRVDEKMRTSDPDILAVGDAVNVKDSVTGEDVLVPLAGPANRQGRTAADAICGIDTFYKNTRGTSIVKVFSLGAASTGLNEKTLKRKGISYRKVYLHPLDHAGYYPGAATITMKLLYSPKDGKILGAQAVGAEGVARRIDVIATAMQAGLTVFDLENSELCYAPPYGSAKDPVNQAAFIAANNLRGAHGLVDYDEISKYDPVKQFVLDVRDPDEFELGAVPGAVLIPLNNLRERLGEVPRDKEILVYCQAGLRGYVALRILAQKGYRVRNLSGGYKIYGCFESFYKGADCELPLQGAGCSSAERSDLEKKPEKKPGFPEDHLEIDARGLQCPGPIMKLKKALDSASEGDGVRITASDPGFTRDVQTWCAKTGNTVVSVDSQKGEYAASVIKGSGAPVRSSGGGENATMVVFSNDLDRAIASFIIANGAAGMGKKVTMFFTFWRLNILRKNKSARVKKSFVEK